MPVCIVLVTGYAIFLIRREYFAKSGSDDDHRNLANVEEMLQNLPSKICVLVYSVKIEYKSVPRNKESVDSTPRGSHLSTG